MDYVSRARARVSVFVIWPHRNNIKGERNLVFYFTFFPRINYHRKYIDALQPKDNIVQGDPVRHNTIFFSSDWFIVCYNILYISCILSSWSSGGYFIIVSVIIIINMDVFSFNLSFFFCSVAKKIEFFKQIVLRQPNNSVRLRSTSTTRPHLYLHEYSDYVLLLIWNIILWGAQMNVIKRFIRYLRHTCN